MSEKQQHTAEGTRETMLSRYGDVHHHKHDKRHTLYRFHCRSHLEQHTNSFLQHEKINSAHKEKRILILQKNRKRGVHMTFH